MNDDLRFNNWETLNQDLISCRKCERLVAWREDVAVTKRKAYRDLPYWGKPVPGFGDLNARILVVGLAPGAHGSNRTGRMFTGDASGDFLFPALYRFGFANQADAGERGDGLQLKDIFITAVGRCAPPQNKIKSGEIQNCLPYLKAEISLFSNIQGMIALGGIAHQHLFKIGGYTKDKSKSKFGHGAFVQEINKPWLLASYHPSRQNTQTGRLTVEMFDQIWQKAQSLLVW
ncbi:MAG: uracil-DNA glycosylase [Anaerolineaceae bacterium]|nr:uracil-DNA glycosylase [Anaerolineaceae bacterium]